MIHTYLPVSKEVQGILRVFYGLLILLLNSTCNKNPEPPIQDEPLEIFTIKIADEDNLVLRQDKIIALNATSAIAQGNVISFGKYNFLDEIGHCWSSASTMPTVTNSENSNLGQKITTGNFQSDIPNLTPSTIYYLRSWIKKGTITKEHPITIKFKTPALGNSLPELEGFAIDSIGRDYIHCRLFLLNYGNSDLLELGYCLSETNPVPTINDDKVVTFTENIIGEIRDTVEGLVPETNYFVRAFVRNQAGLTYSNALIFRTKDDIPEGYVLVEGGSFEMGDNGTANTSPKHTVTVNSFLLRQTETTNAEFVAFLNEYGSHIVKDGVFEGNHMIGLDHEEIIKEANGVFSVTAGFENHPVNNISWYGAFTFCQYYNLRLPTEAEWEYAAKGGKVNQNFLYSGSNSASSVAWYNLNATRSMPVKTKIPNTIGTFDQSGNLWEWCNDWYLSNYYIQSPAQNPMGPNVGDKRVIRGGSWNNGEPSLTTFLRGSLLPYEKNAFTGFRYLKEL